MKNSSNKKTISVIEARLNWVWKVWLGLSFMLAWMGLGAGIFWQVGK